MSDAKSNFDQRSLVESMGGRSDSPLNLPACKTPNIQQDSDIVKDFVNDRMGKQFSLTYKDNLMDIDKTIYRDMGKPNNKHPMKITTNNPITNPMEMAAHYYHKKSFGDLTNKQKMELYKLMNKDSDFVTQQRNLTQQHFDERQRNSKKQVCDK